MPQTSQTAIDASSVAHAERYPLGGRGNGWTLTLAFVAAAASLLVVAPAPSYDPWSWLLWGREIAGGSLSTAEGPAFKPLPVGVCAVLSLVGSAAPALWVVVARAGALLALWLSFRLGRELAGGSTFAGVLAGAGVALCGAFVSYSAAGVITGWLLALALAGYGAWRSGRHGVALACGVGCALLQVEAWPFLGAVGIVLWRSRAAYRPWLAGLAVAIPALWFVPELIGSGDLMRSAERARIPNPGQPALAAVPAFASLEQAAELVLWPFWLGLLALAAGVAWRTGRIGAALVPGAVGLAWVVLVAAMAQLGGFSGEPRYALPGMALIAISGAVGLVTAGRPTRPRPRTIAFTVVVAGLIAVAALPRIGDVVRVRAAQDYQWELARDLTDAVADAGGPRAIQRCGATYVGPLRGPVMAYRLGVPKHTVEPDLPPVVPGTVFRSRRAAGMGIEPLQPVGFREVAATERWQVLQACRVRLP